MKAGIVGASGYTGGELLRLILNHPEVEIQYITSRRYMGKHVDSIHPNLRSLSDIKFEPFEVDRATECDLIFLAVPHGAAMNIAPDILETGVKVIDLSADFRLDDVAVYKKYYGEHVCPELLEKRVYGLPELYRDDIKDASLVSCCGCMATSVILGLLPIIKEDFVDLEHLTADIKIGSSGGGKSFSFASHHPERDNVVRPYSMTGHRHTAEINQELSKAIGNKINVAFSAHGVSMVRGILSTMQIFTSRKVEDKELWKLYRSRYNKEPFIRVIKKRSGNFRLPDPKIVSGSNFCDVGFEIDEDMHRIVVLSALDNLIKGASGSAVQSMNIMFGLKETTGLMIPGLHPI
ncbi:MAG: N-acetyl-gamma-glutamyl-phosphate reductase [Candidatus Lokiarchaeota archaeon]|nr:N-acetyl-gamma-glutamyl-phosphate reductase [Candidatus Lokiarchaeota archaeon]